MQENDVIILTLQLLVYDAEVILLTFFPTYRRIYNYVHCKIMQSLCLKLIEIINVWVYYTFPFGFS